MSLRIFNVHIEPLEERYSAQWERWYKDAFDTLGIKHLWVDGISYWLQESGKIETGQVLDCYKTHHWKFEQLQKIVACMMNDEFKDGDVLFFHDLWFPGIEAIKYIKDMTKSPVKIVGILHAGTWDKYDFTNRYGMGEWAKGFEQSIIALADEIFVATQFHKDLITADLNHPQKEWYSSKILVTGLPFEADQVRPFKMKKEKIVVFPHRLDPEKHPERFDILGKRLKQRHPDWQFIKSKEATKTKEQFYRLLARSAIAVSFADQETFGYSMLEASANGCYCVVPDKLSYREIAEYDEWIKDGNVEQTIAMVETLMKQHLGNRVPSQFTEYRTVDVVRRMFHLEGV